MPRLAHDFAAEPHHQLTLHARAFVALVDLETYPAFIGEHADRLDLLQHLCRQMDALTATMWEVPSGDLNLQFHWQPDDPRQASSGIPPLASGNLRTSGQLALLDDETLLAVSRLPKSDLTRRHDVYQLLVPPGIYAVTVRNAATYAAPGTPVTYTVTLNHHPHPPPRLQPVRLNAHLPFGGLVLPTPNDNQESASHKAPRSGSHK